MSTAGTTTLPNALPSLLERLKRIPRIALLSGAALIVALVVAAVLWGRSEEYRVLYTDLNERDGGEIIAVLTQANVPYKFAEGSGTLMVPADRVHEMRLQLATQGLPRSAGVGFELLDDARFGVSQFAEQVNYQRALEGELARTIESMQAVQRARVHLAIPRQSLFVRDRQAPSASILVHLYPGRVLEPSQIAAIAHLVSSSVPQLPVANISIVDQYGHLLSQPGLDAQGLDDRQLRHVREIEHSYAQRIEAILTPLVGPGNARAQVSAEVDFSKREETRETFAPNDTPGSQAIRSRQTSELDQIGSQLAQGIPGALTNQPPLESIAPLVTGPAAGTPEGTDTGSVTALPPGSSLRRDATTNYEVDRNIVHLQHAVGTVSRLSVAVIVNYRKDDEGEYQPLAQEELDKLNELVKQAMGYSALRGDTLSLMNARFVSEEIPEQPWWQHPEFIDRILTVLGWILALLILIWLWFSVGRPLLRRHLEAPAVAAEPTLDELEEEDEERARREAEAKARRQSRYEENLQTARELAEKDPLAVASILRNWIERDDRSN